MWQLDPVKPVEIWQLPGLGSDWLQCGTSWSAASHREQAREEKAGSTLHIKTFASAIVSARGAICDDNPVTEKHLVYYTVRSCQKRASTL